MSLSSELVSSNSPPDAETEASSSISPITSGSPVTPPRYPTAQLSSSSRKLRPASSRTQRLETFEDLLKEAGYSHTRVITPKAERLAKDAATYSSHTRDDSQDKDASHGADSALTGAARYAARMANFFSSWVATSTTAGTTERGDSQVETVDDWKSRRNGEREHSPTPHRAHTSHDGQNGQAHSSSSRRLHPEPKSQPKFPEPASLEYISPSPSSDTLMTSSTSTSTVTIRPAVQTAPAHNPPLRHTISSPPQYSPTPGTTGSNTPDPNISSSVQPLQKSRSSGHRGTNSRASRPARRSPLPESWQQQQPHHARTQSRSPRRRCPSEKLLARTGSLTLSTSSAAAATATRRGHLQAMTSPVTVSCRSSSVGATTRHKRRKELPSLAPNAETGTWPWTADAAANKNGNGKQGRFSPLPKISVHAANGTGKRPLARTASSSSARGYSSLSRNSSGYANFSRGSNSGYNSLSRTSGTASSSRGGEEVNWADYSYRNSPVASGFKHLPPPHTDADHMDEADDGSEDEPHLSNILAPHISPLEAPSLTSKNPGPVERQRSIQSLRACLRRHESNAGSSRISSPHGASFPVEQIAPMPVLSLPKAELNSQADREAQNLLKRRSLGHGYGRRVEGAADTAETTERGRSDARLSSLGGLNRSADANAANVANAHSSRSPSSGGKGGRTSSTPARVGKKDDKLSKKELERERLLWGTSWGRK